MSSAESRPGRPAPGRAAGHGQRRRYSLLAMTLIAVVALLPFLWMLSTSLKSIDEVFIYPPKWIPTGCASTTTPPSGVSCR